jgi:hypothetical protein
MRTISARHERECLPSAANVSVEVAPLAEAHVGSVRSSLTLLLPATFVVAFPTCRWPWRLTQWVRNRTNQAQGSARITRS